MVIPANRTTVVHCVIIVLLCASTAASADPLRRDESVSKNDILVDTCPRHVGKNECMAILEALRKKLCLAGTGFILETRYLKIARGWAWVVVTPRSADGISIHEDHSALMQKTEDRWSVAELRPGECAENPDCWDDESYFRKLRARFPAAPKGIFPHHK